MMFPEQGGGVATTWIVTDEMQAIVNAPVRLQVTLLAMLKENTKTPPALTPKMQNRQPGVRVLTPEEVTAHYWKLGQLNHDTMVVGG